MTNNTIIALSILENKIMKKNELVKTILANGDVPFHSFNEWKARGFKVKKGEHSVFKAKLWVKTNYSEKELKKMGKDSNWFFLQSTSLFSREQVELAKEEKKFPLSEKTIKELAENGISLKEKNAEKKIASQTSKKSVGKKANIAKANQPKANSKKEITKKTEIGRMTANIDNGIEIIRIDLQKADGTYAWIEMPKAFYLGLKKTEKKRLESLWGLN